MSNPIIYISGGLLGDFIHQLSVINEKYLETGRKGVLYISRSVGDTFRYGVQQAFQDTYPIIIKQQYIEDYKIHNGEPHDVNLSYWRNTPLNTHWNNVYNNVYRVPWGTHPWLTLDNTVDIPPHIEGKVLFCCSTMNERYPRSIDFHKLFEPYGKDNVVFITQNKGEYDSFLNRTGITLPLWMPSSLTEMIVAIGKSALFIGNLSSPMTYAYAFHKKNITLLAPGRCDNPLVLGLETIIPCTFLINN